MPQSNFDFAVESGNLHIRIRLVSICALLSLALTGMAGGDKTDRQQYIDDWKDVAVEQMRAHGIPASITLAQGILESGNGKSMLSKEANNHFGIKCHGWDGPGVYKDDDRKNECFRKYRSARESYEDHSQFLKKKRYQFLYDYKPTDYKSWAKGLKKAGYATDPAYARRLIQIIEDNGLHEFDKEVTASRGKGKRKQKSEPRLEPSVNTWSDDGDVIDLTIAREVLVHKNNIKFIRARKGDTPERVADRMDMAPWQLRRYNDVATGHTFNEGDIIYIQPKRNKSKAPFHKAIEGETLRVISQNYGVRLDRLEKYNALEADHPLQGGEKVLLQKP